jgi:proline iminopeptidase
MPYANTPDDVQLYYEEAGEGTPILFIHEFAADYSSWEPQMRYFSRHHRCITYSARGYIPSHIPAADAYSYKHFRDDAIAMLDFLKIEKAHLVGLSMGAYSALQVGISAPQRALSLTLAGVGSGFEKDRLQGFREQCMAHAEEFEKGDPDVVAKISGMAPGRMAFMLKDPRGFKEFYDALARHDAQGSAHTQRGFQGGRHQAGRSAELDHRRRRGRFLHRAEPVFEEADRKVGACDVSENRPRAEPGRAGPVQ